MNEELKSTISAFLKNQIRGINPESGGSINRVYKVTSHSGEQLLLKVSDLEKYPEMFEKEAFALSEMGKTGLPVPENVMLYTSKKEQFLFMKYYPHVFAPPELWFKAGENLANMHRVDQKEFGWKHDNYMGSVVQLNHVQQDIHSFYRENRIEPLIRLCRNENLLTRNHIQQSDKLFSRSEEIIPTEKPALIHGDLWRGNVITTKTGCIFIDPASAGSHREFDLAMSMLFEKFPNTFYDGYQEAFPLEKGWQKRIDYFNLYPLLVHLYLFGTSYYNQVDQILRQF